MRVRWLNILLLLAMLLAVLPAGTITVSAAATSPQQANSIADKQAVPTGPFVSARVRPAHNQDLSAIPASAPDGNKPDQLRELPGGKLHSKGVQQVPTGAGDAVVQTALGPNSMPNPIQNWEGVNNLDGVYPPDTDGSVGKNHYVQMVNLHTAIYDKSGNLLYGPFTPNLLWPSGDPCNLQNDGDPVVLYDRFADRWLLSQFALPNYPDGPFYECIAISKGPVPTNVPADWWAYTFLVSNTKMDDYPKIAIWPDGYYMSENLFYGGSNGNAGVVVFDRAKMLLGQAATFQSFDLTNVNTAYSGQLPVDLEGPNPPPAGMPAMFMQVSDQTYQPTLGPDAMHIWQFHVDWANPANTTFGTPAHLPNFVLPVENFDALPCTLAESRSCIPQPGTSVKLDAIGDRLMFRATYRNFGDHSSIVVNHTVKADGTDRAGIRWYEVRGAETTPAIYQQSTFAPADGNYRWMGSVTTDHAGNTALGYSVASGSTYPSIRYAGRLVSDPLNTLPQGEETIIDGTGSQTGTGSRWGDYSAMTIDPVDDCTFWYTQEYIQTTGGAPWRTRIASFRFPSCALGPQGTLAGTVVKTGTGNPIVGATITASASVTQTGSTTSNPDGSYSMLLLTGTYTVTASAYGYLPKTIPNVVISENQTTDLPVTLDQADSYTVSGKVFDPQAGWPLYARITVENTPVPPVYTDPATGAYSVALLAGTNYTLRAEPFVQGYMPATVQTGVVTGDLTLNIPVQADMNACNAPGYTQHGAFEGFEGAFPPSGWTVTKTPSSCNQWTNTDPGGRGNLTGGSGKFAVADVDVCGSGSTMDTTLTTPIMDFSSVANVALSFKYDYNWYAAGEHAYVDVTGDGGTTWQNIVDWTSNQSGPATYNQDLSSIFGGSSQAQVRFHYLAPGWDFWWQVDDVFVGARDCHVNPGGMVVGAVYNSGTGEPLAGATVGNDSGGSTTTVATPADPSLGDFYALFSPAGDHQYTASKAQFASKSVTVTVPVSNTVRQDFGLASGHLIYNPAAIDQTVTGGAQKTVPVAVSNVGSGAAQFQITELDKGGAPFGPIEKPPFVVKPFRQHMVNGAEAFKETVGTLPAFPGSVIQSWNVKASTPWGIAFDGRNHKVLIGDPKSWGGDGRLYEYNTNGTPTGRGWAFNWNPENGPADAAYNWQTGTVWMVDVPGTETGCIYEINPASGPTGKKICPQGITVSQRGLAYDPSTNTFFAGGWNDQMIYRFKADGTVISAKNVGINIAGLAYNPTTGHLFVVNNSNTEKFFVLDPDNNYAGVGQFTVPQLTALGGAGLEIDCGANLWAVDQTGKQVFQISTGESTKVCNLADVAWLSASPLSGTVQPGQTVTVDVTLDSSKIVPGVWNAALMFTTDTPYTVPDLPVKMTANIPPSWGKLAGTVTTNGYCDSNPAPLSNLPVVINSAAFTQPVTVRTDANGFYYLWTDQGNSPLTVSVNAGSDYATGSATGVVLTGQQTTVRDFTLRYLKPCLNAAPSSVSATLSLGTNTNRPLILHNNGGATATFNMTEEDLGFTPPANQARAPVRTVTIGDGVLAKNPHPPARSSDPNSQNAHKVDLASTTITESASQTIISGNSVGCNNTATGFTTENHYLRVFDLPAFNITSQFKITNVEVGIEDALAGSTTQPAEVRLYTLNGAFVFANLTPIGSASVNISDQSLTKLSVPVQGTAPAGSKLVVDFYIPDGATAGNTFFVGSNNLGQTAPTYLAAVDCGLAEPATTDSIGFPEMMLVMNVTGQTGGTAADVPWLSEQPISGTVAADGSAPVSVLFDAAKILVPGTYMAAVNVNSNDPGNQKINVPATLLVTAPANWGILQGTANSLGYCDANPAVLPGADVLITGSNGMTRTLTTDSAGAYLLWLPDYGNPYTVQVAAKEHVTNQVSGVVVTGQGTTTQDVNLRWARPCVSETPSNAGVTLPWQGTANRQITLTNSGPISTPFTITEKSGGFMPMRPAVGDMVLLVATSTSDAQGVAYKTALTTLGYTTVDATPAAFIGMNVADLLAQYKAVIFVPASSTTLGPTGTALAKTQAYLDAGGRFLVSYNDLGYYWRNTAAPNFYTGYIGANYISDEGSLGNVTGQDIMAGVNTSLSADPFPDSVQPAIPEAVTIFKNDAPNTDYAALATARLNYKLVYFAFNFNYLGNAAVQVTALQKALGWLTATTTDVLPWLTETPATGSLVPNAGSQVVTLNFNGNDASVTQPGTYYGKLQVDTKDPVNNPIQVAVTMTVNPPPTYGKLWGTVRGLAACDVNPTPLANAKVRITGAPTQVYTVTTDANGYYQLWFTANAPWSIGLFVSAPNYVQQDRATFFFPGADPRNQRNFDLSALQPCVTPVPTSLSATLNMGANTTLPLNVGNTGYAQLQFALRTTESGFVPLNGPQAAEILLVNDNTTAAASIAANLSKLGWTYQLASTSSLPPFSDFKAVIWPGNQPSPANQTLLMNYLDAGGRLLMTGNDVGYYLKSTVFYQNYLEANYVADDGSQGNITGADIMSGINTSLAGDPYPDSFTLNGPDAAAIFTNDAPNTDLAGSLIARNNYRAVYLAWNFNYTGGGDATKQSILSSALNWLVPPPAWLTVNPTTGTVDPGLSAPLLVKLDAAVAQPGKYLGAVNVASNTPGWEKVSVPVTMTVNAPATWGKLQGTVTSKGYCDANPTPAANASVVIHTGNGMTITVTTDAAGHYQWWMDHAASPVSVEVTAPNHEPGTATGVVVSGGQTTTEDFALRLLEACTSVDPKSFDLTLKLGTTQTELLNIFNNGAEGTPFELKAIPRVANAAKPITARPVMGKPYGKVDLSVQKSGRASAVAGKSWQPLGPVDLVVDDGSMDNSIGVNSSTVSYQFIWMNRFTPAPAEFPLRLEQISVMWPSPAFAGQDLVGKTVELVVYQDPDGDGDPSNAELVGNFNVTINVADGATWENYALPGPLALQGPGDVLIGVIDRYVVSGVDARQWPAGLDETTSQGRSWIGWWAGDPPVPPVLPPDTTFNTVDNLGLPGNLLIRGSGQTESGSIAWLTTTPVSGTLAADSSQLADVIFNAQVISQTGVYKALLNFISNDPMHGTISLPVTMTVGDVPQCAFTTSSPTLLGQTTVFTNTSVDALTYRWDFGDGSDISGDENPTHTYANVGLYTVVLTATNSLGNSLCNGSVSVESLPVPSFASDSPQPLGTAIVFTNTTPAANPPVTSCLWDFGDSQTVTVANPSHVYTIPGPYTVTLTAVNALGSAAFTGQVLVTAADLVVSPLVLDVSLNQGQTTTRTLTIGNSGNAGLAWSLAEVSAAPWLAEDPQNGTVAPGNQMPVVVSFDTAGLASGTYTTTLNVLSNDPGKPALNVPVTLTVGCPQITSVNYTYTPAAPKIGQSVHFTGSTVGGGTVTYTWNFGDGSASGTGSPVDHTFPTPNPIMSKTYSVQLTVANACGNSKAVAKDVTVRPYWSFFPIMINGAAQ